MFGRPIPHEEQDIFLAGMKEKYAGDEKALLRLSAFERDRPGKDNDATMIAIRLELERKTRYLNKREMSEKEIDATVARETTRRLKEGE